MQLKYKEIHVIGDSHFKSIDVGYFFIPNYYYRHSPMTMYWASKQKTFYRLSFNPEEEIPKDGFWIFCFGEIDVRCLIYNQIHEKNRQEDEVIETLVNDYIENLLTIYSEIGIMSVSPPARRDPVIEDVNYPFVGPDEDRSRYTKKLNAKLQEKCKEKNLLYINVYDAYKDEEGFLIKELSDGSIHIEDKSRVYRVLEELGFRG